MRRRRKGSGSRDSYGVRVASKGEQLTHGLGELRYWVSRVLELAPLNNPLLSKFWLIVR